MSIKYLPISVITMTVCKESTCTKVASFNLATEKTPIYCGDHKLGNMINVKHRKCKADSCTKVASFNYLNEKSPLYCGDHKLANIVPA